MADRPLQPAGIPAKFGKKNAEIPLRAKRSRGKRGPPLRRIEGRRASPASRDGAVAGLVSAVLSFDLLLICPYRYLGIPNLNLLPFTVLVICRSASREPQKQVTAQSTRAPRDELCTVANAPSDSGLFLRGAPDLGFMPGWFMQQTSTPIGTPVLLLVSCDDTEKDSVAMLRYGEPGAGTLRALGS